MSPVFQLPPPLPKPANPSVGIGCVGAGFIMADCHLVAYRAAGLNPVAISARRREQATEVAKRHAIDAVYDDHLALLADERVELLDVAVPPDAQLSVIADAVKHGPAHGGQLRGILAQKPLGVNLAEAVRIVEMCEAAGVVLAVNQNMRFDQSIASAARVMAEGMLGDPVLATIDMRAIPHWMPWQQRMGWVTCRIMSIHHLDTMRYWFGNPRRVYASFRPDPRTAESFDHEDGICLYILEYENGLRCNIVDDVWTGPAREGAKEDIGIHWRIEGTSGMARGTIGWPNYPERSPSTLAFTTSKTGMWHRPKWDSVWFPDAFDGPMRELICALEQGREPTIGGRDNLATMALVEAAYQSARSHAAVEPGVLLQNRGS